MDMTLSAAPSRVAVIMPVYRARYLGEALESVFCQSLTPDEVIVIDDGSPDQEEMERTLSAFDGGIRLLRQTNQGAGAARNAGIRATSAELIALLDADDRWLPEFLAEQVALLDACRHIHVSYTNALYVGRTRLAGRTFMSACPSRGEVTLESLLAQECTVPLSATVARRDAMMRTGLFDSALRRGQDFDLWLRMARNGARFSYSEKVLALRRHHDDNVSGTQVNEIERALNVFVKTLATMDLGIAERAAAERRIRALTIALARERGKERLLEGDFAAARVHLETVARQCGWKVRAALLGLRIAPALVRRFYARSATTFAS
jgi:glycosyltransferase involved in cell wall biosynthesis